MGGCQGDVLADDNGPNYVLKGGEKQRLRIEGDAAGSRTDTRPISRFAFDSKASTFRHLAVHAMASASAVREGSTGLER